MNQFEYLIFLKKILTQELRINFQQISYIKSALKEIKNLRKTLALVIDKFLFFIIL